MAAALAVGAAVDTASGLAVGVAYGLGGDRDCGRVAKSTTDCTASKCLFACGCGLDGGRGCG